jgi:hypothetical protein
MNHLKREWDRFGIYLLLMAFGAYSTVYPIVSFERAAPYWAEIMLGIEFFIAAILLMIGLTGRKKVRMAGLLVVAIGLTTISLVVGIQGGTRVLAYAFLFGAFAMQSVSDILTERRKRQAEIQEELALAEELVELAVELRQGERR